MGHSYGSDPWPRNFQSPRVWPKKGKKKNKTEDKIKSFAKYFSLALLFLRKLLQGVFH